MAKRRILKKSISYIADDLFTEVLVCKMMVPGLESEKTDPLLSRIVEMQEEFIRRAHYPDGKDNKKLVREYYKKLVADLETEAHAIVDAIEELRKEKTT